MTSIEILRSHLICWAIVLLSLWSLVDASDDIVGCGGFVQSAVPIPFEKVGVKLYTKAGALKLKTECAPNNGYFLVAVYDKGDYVVKIDPPEGWNFEPREIELHIDGKTDPCVKGVDINFKFTGYTVKGMVSSKGRDQGPSGLNLKLKSQDSERAEQLTMTSDKGVFVFNNVLPGQYKVQGSHPLWRLEQAEVDIEVKLDNLEILNTMVVAGYDVKGHVLSGDQPIKGVIFVLFAAAGQGVDARGCDAVDSNLLSKLGKQIEQLTPVCSVASGEDGLFVFPSVSSGDYSLIPHYSSQHITFDVVPPQITFSVKYKSVVLKTPFQVHGFSVSGKVADGAGKGLAGVTVKLIGETAKEGTTVADGSYVVENVTIGNYKLVAVADHIFFDEKTIYITPNTPHLPEIQPLSYSVCGSIVIKSSPAGSLPLLQRKVMMLPVGSQNSEMSTQNVNAKGEFCFKATPGSYKVEALVGPGEQKVGFVLHPAEVVVTVAAEPVLGVSFKQFLAAVRGKLACVSDCGNAEVTLSRLLTNDKVTAEMTYAGKEAVFTFTNVLPGKYKVVPVKEKWCWEPRVLEVEVVDKDVSDLQLNHVGYILKCVLSHDIKLNFTVEGVNETVGSFSLSKGSNTFCLKEAGIYHLVPWSCFKFDQSIYIYDTNQPSTLALSVVAYKVAIEVIAPKELSDLSILVRSQMSISEEILKPTLKEVERDNAASNETKPAPPTSFSYVATFWGKLDDRLEVSAQSNEVLFNPQMSTVKVTDNCPGGKAQLEGKEGVFAAGAISPPIADVMITVTTLSSENHKKSVTYTALTKADGRYSIGPLHDDIQYEVSALKSGYVLKADGESKVNFIAQKLSEIKVQIIDTFGNPMGGVLLSLSGGQFRSNSLTPESGDLSFIDLAPGSYYLRPMQKEFSFEPSAQLVDVKEGAVSTLQIRGVRVAFSCHGVVTTLSREPERQVTVEAVGLDECSEYQEESLTDNDGYYRLRGLHPKCRYVVRLQVQGEGQSSQISRTAPYNRTVQIVDQDLTDANFIAFHKPKSFELTVFVETDQSNLNNLKVLLFDEDNLDMPLHTMSPAFINHIFFPPLPLVKTSYVLRIASTVSHKTHDIKSTSATFSTDGLFKKHVVLKFSAEKKRFDPEPTQSVIALPFAVALVLLIYNYDTAVPFLLNAYNIIKSKLDNNSDAEQDSGDEAKIRKKKR